MQLRGLGLALERAQPRPRLALHVQGAGEVLLGALELELGAAAALAVLAQPGGLLDEHAPVARLGEHDGLHAALRDHRVHLLAQAGVGQDLDHVGQAAAGAVEAVLALAVAAQPAQDRDLREVGVLQPAVAVVDDHLDLGRAGALDAVAAGEDHVLHRLAADRQRALLAQRPQHRVGDVGLARAVGPDHHAHAGREVELGPVREGLEALHRDRLEVHQTSPSASRAASAASCSAPFLVRPVPRPSSRPPDSATATKLRACAGPSSSTIR